MSTLIMELSGEQLLHGLKTGALDMQDSEVKEAVGKRLDVGDIMNKAGTDKSGMCWTILLNFPEQVVAYVNGHEIPWQKWSDERDDFHERLTLLLTKHTRRDDEATARACMKFFDHLVYNCHSIVSYRDYPSMHNPTSWARKNIEIMLPDLFKRLRTSSAWQDEELVWKYVQLAFSIVLHEYAYTNKTALWNWNSYTFSDESLTEAANLAKLALKKSVRNPVVRQQLLRFMTGKDMAENRHEPHYEAVREFLFKIVKPSKEELVGTL